MPLRAIHQTRARIRLPGRSLNPGLLPVDRDGVSGRKPDRLVGSVPTLVARLERNRGRKGGLNLKAVQHSIRDAVDTMAQFYGPAPAPFPTEPFEIILWENAAYLADDARRLRAFEVLRSEIGTRPEEILSASSSQLRRVTSHGILSELFTEKLRTAARLAMEECGGDLNDALRLPSAEAVRILRRFPGIGEPAAEKILLFARGEPLLAPESNALRVLVRLGSIPEGPSYAATYAAARELARKELGDDAALHLAAHQHLRRLGSEICRRTAPRCTVCPLASTCNFARRSAAAPTRTKDVRSKPTATARTGVRPSPGTPSRIRRKKETLR